MAFLEEFQKLKKSMPLRSGFGYENENSDYGDYLFHCKNVYYGFDSSQSVDSFYTYDCYQVENSMDLAWCVKCQECYECNDCFQCYSSFYLDNCDNSYNCYFCYKLDDCHDCFLCANIEHKSFCIENKQYEKEEYERKVKQLLATPRDIILKRLDDLKKKFPNLYGHYFSNENSDYGDYVYKCSNCYFIFNSDNCEDSGYLTNSSLSQSCWDSLYSYDCKECYETNDCESCYNTFFSSYCARCTDSAYLYSCDDCDHCFGCVELTNKKFCLLNKQYTEEEYNKRLNEIKRELRWPLVNINFD
ncbi:MAG: hypothetical protein M1355_04075 [Patescibacteria group bacterium]|nr:hypothetical protein [Patescibacteria group bacterium]